MSGVLPTSETMAARRRATTNLAAGIFMAFLAGLYSLNAGHLDEPWTALFVFAAASAAILNAFIAGRAWK